MKDHWAKQYKNAPGGTLEQWIYLAACNIICRKGEEGEHERRAREVGKYCFDNNCAIWHGVWATSPYKEKQKCYCALCVKARS